MWCGTNGLQLMSGLKGFISKFIREWVCVLVSHFMSFYTMKDDKCKLVGE